MTRIFAVFLKLFPVLGINYSIAIFDIGITERGVVVLCSLERVTIALINDSPKVLS